ncbi:hypothetical protein OG589_43035 [Sphaerisporangium sp. NBC_01403]
MKVALAGLIVFCAVLAAAGAVFATTVPEDGRGHGRCTSHSG